MQNSLNKWIASSLLIFLSLLLFGGVDLWSQVIVFGIWVLGVKAQPLRGDVFPFYLVCGIMFFLLFLIAKELLPLSFFFESYWRTSLREDYGVYLGKFHHPEWTRFLKFFIQGIGIAGLIWWWRSFSDTRTLRIQLAWSGFIAIVVVALCSFALKDEAIFKLRPTLGYDGFGPFPNRNHTGALMVMGLFLGWGCAWESFKHRLTLQSIFAVLGMTILAVALVASNSRGAIASGLMAFLMVLILTCFHKKDFRFLVVGVAIVVIAISFVSLSGSSLMKRVQAEISPQKALAGRIEIWKDSLKVIQEAPWIGHGVGMYEKVIPFYQTDGKPNHQVLHPESTYLQLLAEGGVLLSLLGVTLILLMVFPAWDEMRSHHQFPLRICSLGGLMAIGIHGCIDVPILRWGNAVIAALCWAIFTATRLPSHDESQRDSHRSYLFPLICGLILAGLGWISGARWGERNLGKQSLSQLEQLIKIDPLNGAYRHERGKRYIANEATREEGYREFRLSHRLLPTAWTLPVEAALAVQPYSEGIALSFWARGIERSGHRSDEIFMMAVNQTRLLPNASRFWKQFIDLHPALILSYLVQEKPLEASRLFESWKESRGKLKRSEWGVDERRNFYEVVVQLNQGEYWREWVKEQEEPEVPERRVWVSVAQCFGDFEGAWESLSKTWTPIQLPSVSQGKEELFQREWSQNPTNWVNSRNWIEWLHANGRIEERDQVLMQVASIAEAPFWFKQLVAQVLGEKKNYREAVEWGG